MPLPLSIRPSTDADLASVAALYGWHVERGTGSFELEAPSLAEMQRRRTDVIGAALPWLVAESGGGRIVGYAYAARFRARPAYRFCVEDSVYVAHDAQRSGVGRLLLAELMARCQQAGVRQMLALIGDAANASSIALHAALGFRHAGVLAASGRKFDRWLDVVVMQRALGRGSNSQPPEQ